MQQHMFQTESDWPEPFLLLSLAPPYAHALIVEGTKRYEYRRGNFLHQPFTAFIYATLGKGRHNKKYATGAITGFVHFDDPIIGIEEVAACKESEEPGSRNGMLRWLQGSKTASAHPVKKVGVLQEPLTLAEVRQNIARFQPPQRYLRLENHPMLFDFLREKSGI